jgi:hypothetical protein
MKIPFEAAKNPQKKKTVIMVTKALFLFVPAVCVI